MAMQSRSLIRLEVERKFSAEIGTLQNLTTNRRAPRFQTLVCLGQQSIEDQYYDRSSVLSSKGIWVRRRNGNWEAKIRKGGSFTNSQFQELSDPQTIAKHVNNLIPTIQSQSENFGLESIASFTTTRHLWKADTKFIIALDTTDFGHSVGEVELEFDLDITGKPQPSVDQETQTALAKMDRQIEIFMRRYSWAFPLKKPVGKLSAYFEWERNKKGHDR
jgi:thiamine-triphosphatase